MTALASVAAQPTFLGRFAALAADVAVVAYAAGPFARTMAALVATDGVAAEPLTVAVVSHRAYTQQPSCRTTDRTVGALVALAPRSGRRHATGGIMRHQRVRLAD